MSKQLELWDRYTQDALALECKNKEYDNAQERLGEPGEMRILHASMGIAGEGGEVLDLVKKHVFYNKPLDRAKVTEEVGDIMWYVSVLLQVMDIGFDEVLAKNITKLRARYGGESFSSYDKMNRDKSQVQAIMEEDHEDHPGSGC